MFEKYKKDGKVVILVSYGFGAGWSTWNSENPAQLAMDKRLVEAKLKGVDEEEIEVILKDMGLEDTYTGGWDQVEIEWLYEGTAFEIDEYDGAESLRKITSISDFTIA